MHARYDVGTGTIDVYIDKNAFDLLPLSDETHQRNKEENKLIELICIGMAEKGIGHGRIAQTFQISSVLITPQHIQIIYLDDTNSPTTLNMSRKPTMPNFFSYKGIVPEVTSDVHLLKNVKKRQQDIDYLKVEQNKLARKNFLEQPVFDPPDPPSEETLLKNNRPSLLRQTQSEFSKISTSLRTEIEKSAEEKLAQLQRANTELIEKVRKHSSNIVGFIIPADQIDRLPKNPETLVFNYTADSNAKLQLTAKDQQEALAQQRKQISDHVSNFNRIVTQEQRQHIEQSEKIMANKAKIVHAMHLAARESFDLVRLTNSADEREAARLKFNEIYAGFAAISEIGKLSYSDAFLLQPMDTLTKINTALATAAPTFAERAMNTLDFTGKQTHLKILQAKLGNLAPLIKIENNRLHVQAQAYNEEQELMSHFNSRAKKLAEAGEKTRKELVAMNVTKEIQAATKKIDTTAKTLAESQHTYLHYLRLNHRAQEIMKEAELALTTAEEIHNNAQKLKKSLEQLPQNNKLMEEVLPLVTKTQENFIQIKTLVEKMREQDRKFRDKLSTQFPSSENVIDFVNTLGELNATLDPIHSKDANSIVPLYKSSIAVEEQLKVYENNLLFYQNLSEIDRLIANIETYAGTLDAKSKTAKEGLAHLQNLYNRGFKLEHENILAAVNSSVEIEASISLITAQISALKILRQEYTDELQRPNVNKENRATHVDNLNNIINQINSTRTAIESHSSKINQEQRHIQNLYQNADNQSQPIFTFTSNLLDAIYNIDFWKDQVRLLGGNKVGNPGTRVPTGIAKMINILEQTEKKYPDWHTNPRNISTIIQALQKIAMERLEKHRGSKFNLFTRNNLEDKNSMKFYKILAELDLSQLANNNYHNDVTKKLETFLPQKNQPNLAP